MQRSGSRIWTENPCKLLRKDMIQRHRSSQMHKEELEGTLLSAERDGGIRQVFSTQVVLNRKALIGALRIMYWLAKEEIPHTKFNSLKELAIYLGCDYLNELCVGRKAQYTSEQTNFRIAPLFVISD